MKGMELCEEFFKEYGLPLINGTFSEYKDQIAAGLVGHGSECFGYDDHISTDHDYQAGFCIWLTDEAEKEFGFKLFRAYSKLPKEYKGLKIAGKSLFGSENMGVKTIKDFYSFYIPNGEVPTTDEEWFNVPDFYLAEATNGKVFCDPVGEFTCIRNRLKHDIPLNVKYKKLASSLFYAAQYGQYNYSRCLKHGEKVAAAYALSTFAEHAAKIIFLLAGTHAPYYKWLFRALANQPHGNDIAVLLEKALASPYDGASNGKIIEEVSSKIISLLKNAGLADNLGDYLEPYAYKINSLITNANLRNSPVML